MANIKFCLSEATKNNYITVYHGTKTPFDKFDLNQMTQKIIWFTNDKEALLRKEKGAQGHGYILTLKVKINNPAGWDEYEKMGLWELENAGYDGAILPDPDDTFDGFVFKNNQVKIVDKEKVD